MDTPNNPAEMMKMAARAGEEDDVQTLQRLRDLNQAWLQTDEERDSMDYLLDVLQTKVLEALIADS